MEEIDFGEIQQVLDEILGTGIDFRKMAEQGMKGESFLSLETLAGFCRMYF